MIFDAVHAALVEGLIKVELERYHQKLAQERKNRQMTAQAEAILRMGSIEGECREVIDGEVLVLDGPAASDCDAQADRS